jgi:CheY-like chemotaxis protein/two-component sensor histidine kinase
MRVNMQPVDLVATINRAIESTAPLINRKRHRFELELDVDSVWMEGDPIRLTQIFENLIANAAKYTDEGGEIRLELRVAGAQAVVEVADNGLGLDPRLAGRIFDLFVQDHRSLDRSQGGMGIGLALVRHLASLHGGSVEAFSEGLNRGSRFIVRLPLLSDAPDERTPIEDEGDSRHTQRILVVDDDLQGAASLVMLLEMSGHDVSFAADGHDAVEVARRLRPDVALLDIGMAEGDGYDVARRLRELPEMAPDAAYIAITGFGRPEDFERSEKAGFFRHLVKPVDPSVLEAVLQEAFRARAAAKIA